MHYERCPSVPLLLASSLLIASRALALPVATDPQWPFPNPQPLRFAKDGTFQISVFEDLHYGEAEDLSWGPKQDIDSERVINAVLDAESPQLVVLNGDLITGENTYLANSSLYIDAIVRPLVKRGLIWASTYGNHDSNFNLSSKAMLEREHTYPNSLTASMVLSPDAGVTNYYLPVFSSDVSEPTPELILWFFDSRGGKHFQELDNSGNEIPYPGYVDESVVQWFQNKSEMINDIWHRNIPSLVFVHIPVYAMAAFQNAGVNAKKEPGINDDDPLAPQGITNGVYTGDDIPFMSALLDTPNIIAVFSGHDHGDDWCFKWDSELPGMNLTGNGMNFCFGRHSGYGGYGNWMRGSRQILINEKHLNKKTETWIRLEDGSISGKITLNATYGQDEYPPVNHTYTYE